MNADNCLKFRSDEGKVWSIIFNHPLRLNSDGKPGRWMRRSLSTVNSKIADTLVGEMKDLLSDESLWNESNKHRAEIKYNPIIVSAFYDSIEPQAFHNDSMPIRESLLPLPSIDDGYNRVLFVGTTGAGKTTLLRHLIGTDIEKFPLTTTAKATVSDLEVIIAGGTYKSVVTFFSKSMTNSFVQECVYHALIDAMNGGDKKKISQSLVVNEEQTFRLNYIIGNYSSSDEKRQSMFVDDEDEDDDQNDVEKSFNRTQEYESNNVDRYIERIIHLADSELEKLNRNEESESVNVAKNDNDYSEIFQNMIYANSEFKAIVEDIITDIIKRFQFVKKGIIKEDKEGWAQYWEFETDDRTEFLESLRIFSSNYHGLFGQLLTPLVQGMRVQGPLYPKNLMNEKPKLVFIDGQGLGHTADSAQTGSIPTKLENLFECVDTILLVDNSTNPIQAAPLTALKSVIISGYKDKLAIAFTHFDSVQGDNFVSTGDKKDHVYDSLINGFSTLKEEIGSFKVNSLEQEFVNRCFFLSNLNQKTSLLNKSTKKQLNRLFTLFQSENLIPHLAVSKPQYNKEMFSEEIYKSVENFRMLWDMRFDGCCTREYYSPFNYNIGKKEHWTRIKALNRRIAEFNTNEYDDIRPVFDLTIRLKTKISLSLDEPTEWKQNEPSDDEKSQFTDAVQRNVSKQLGYYIEKNMIDNQKNTWIQAYKHSGSGSTRLRSRDINMIYGQVAPLMKSSANWREFIDEIWSMVQSSIDIVYESTIDQSLEEPMEASNFVNDGDY